MKMRHKEQLHEIKNQIERELIGLGVIEEFMELRGLLVKEDVRLENKEKGIKLIRMYETALYLTNVARNYVVHTVITTMFQVTGRSKPPKEDIVELFSYCEKQTNDTEDVKKIANIDTRESRMATRRSRICTEYYLGLLENDEWYNRLPNKLVEVVLKR